MPITYSSDDLKGFTLPVWVAAAARAAIEILIGQPFVHEQPIEVPDQNKILNVSVSSASLLAGGKQALAISHCESGLGLDLTRGLEIWAFVQFQDLVLPSSTDVTDLSESWLHLVPGCGVGIHESSGLVCLSTFARDLLHINLRPLVPEGLSLKLEIVFPRGRELAERTSNQAFGVVDGLALIGTQAEAQESASPENLQMICEQLRRQCADSRFAGVMTLVIGENGFDLALKSGIPSHLIVKTGNWLGPLFVAAAEEGVKELLVFGYHGKMIKLAGGIFHTHHHLADGRLEVLTTLALREEIPLFLLKSLSRAQSVQAAFLELEAYDSKIAHKLWSRIAQEVEKRSDGYLGSYGSWSMSIGAALFDRQRKLRWAGSVGLKQLAFWGITLYT